MKTINLSGLDMKKFIGTGYNPSQDTVNISGRDNGRTEHERIKNSQKQIVEEPKERPEVYY